MKPSKLVLSFLLLTSFEATRLEAAEIPVQGSVLAHSKKLAGATVRLVEAPDRAADIAVRFGEVPFVELARTKSDRDGYFSLLAPGPGFYRLIYEAEGHLSLVSRLNLFGYSHGAVTAVDLLPARKAVLTVRDGEGKPIAGARLRLAFEESEKVSYLVWPEFVSTGSDGRVALSLPQGDFGEALIAVPGFALHKENLAAGNERYEAKLEKGQEVAIEVVDGRRRALPNVSIFMPGTGMPIGITGKSGKVTIHVLPEHRRFYLYDAEGRGSMESLPQGLPGEQAKPWRLELDDPSVLSGQVVELESRLPLADAWVYIDSSPPLFTRSDRNGRFELVVSPSRRSRRLNAFKSGYRPGSIQITEVSPALMLGLEPAAQAVARVVDAAGVGIGGAEVTATSEQRPYPLSQVISDQDGNFLFEELEVGKVVELRSRLENLESPKAAVGPLVAGERVEVELILPQKINWSCRIVDPEGKPISQAEVLAVSVPGEGAQRLSLFDLLRSRWAPSDFLQLGTSDAQGRLQTSSLAAGTYDLGFLATGYGPEIQSGVKVGRMSAAKGAAEETRIVLKPAPLVRGRVVDLHGKGLEGVALKLILIDSSTPSRTMEMSDDRTVATTDPQGTFEFTSMFLGKSFKVLAEREGYISLRSPQILAQEGRSILLELRRGGQVHGKVSARGAALAGASLVVLPADPARGSGGPTAKTKSDGTFEIDGLDQISYRLKVVGPPGLQAFESEPFTVASGERVEIDAELQEAAIVYGRVLQPGGERVADAGVFIVRAGASDNQGKNVDALGQYRIEDARPGPATIRVQAPNGRHQDRQVVLEEGVNEIDIVLEKGPLGVQGKVLDAAGEPIVGATVYLQGSTSARANSGADGLVVFEDLDKGMYFLQIEKPGFFLEPQPLQIEEVALEGLEWRMKRARSSLVGQIYGLGAAQLAALKVRASQPSGTERFGILDGSRYSFAGLPEGNWTLVAAVPEEGMAVVQEVAFHSGEIEVEQDLDFGSLAGPWVGHVQKGGRDVSGVRYGVLSATTRKPLFGAVVSGSRVELRLPAGTYRLAILSEVGIKELGIEVGKRSEELIELESN